MIFLKQKPNQVIPLQTVLQSLFTDLRIKIQTQGPAFFGSHVIHLPLVFLLSLLLAKYSHLEWFVALIPCYVLNLSLHLFIQQVSGECSLCPRTIVGLGNSAGILCLLPEVLSPCGKQQELPTENLLLCLPIMGRGKLQGCFSAFPVGRASFWPIRSRHTEGILSWITIITKGLSLFFSPGTYTWCLGYSRCPATIL